MDVESHYESLRAVSNGAQEKYVVPYDKYPNAVLQAINERASQLNLDIFGDWSGISYSRPSVAAVPVQEIIIDGSYGEGGGRIFRDSVMYATIKALQGWRGKATISSIRSSRPNPGVKNSLFGIVDFCQQLLPLLKTSGLSKGSPEVTLDFNDIPQDLVLKPHYDFIVDANELGSAWLLFLAVHPVLMALPSTTSFSCQIMGGTDVFFPKDKSNPHTLTPPTKYMLDVWWPNMNTLNLMQRSHEITVNITRDHRDLKALRKSGDYSISCISNSNSSLSFAVVGLLETDGILKYTTRDNGVRVGVAHPYHKFKVKVPSNNFVYDEHFADMQVPYQDMDIQVMSQHHLSAIYVKQAFNIARS